MVHSLGSLVACVNDCAKGLSAPTKIVVGLAFLTSIAALNSFDPSRQKSFVIALLITLIGFMLRVFCSQKLQQKNKSSFVWKWKL